MNKKTFLLLITAVSAIGGLLFGYDTGVINGAQFYLSKHFDLDSAMKGWVVGSALLGCLVGAIASGPLSIKFGRKHSLILSAVLFSLSAYGSGLPVVFSESISLLVVFRIIGGLGIGIASMNAPMYIAEIAPSDIRGKMVTYYQLAIVVGFFVVFLATYFIGGGDTQNMTPEVLAQLHEHNVNQGWRIMLWSELLPALAFLALLFTVPHSPRWLILQGRTEEAKTVLAQITSSEQEAASEFADIETSLTNSPAPNLAMLFGKGIGFALFLGVMLSIFQQVTGINAILYYGAEIFSNALGYGPEDALKQQLWLGAVNLIFTFVAIYKVDSWGRKPLFIGGSIGMCAGLTVLGLTIYTQQMGVVSLIAVLVFIASFAMSMGPVVWVILSEMFPNNVRSVAMSIAVAAQWLFNALVANSFPLVNQSTFNQEGFNGALPYFIFASFCVVAMIFVWKLVPETKGKTLEEMEALWAAKDQG